MLRSSGRAYLRILHAKQNVFAQYYKRFISLLWHGSFQSSRLIMRRLFAHNINRLHISSRWMHTACARVDELFNLALDHCQVGNNVAKTRQDYIIGRYYYCCLLLLHAAWFKSHQCRTCYIYNIDSQTQSAAYDYRGRTFVQSIQQHQIFKSYDAMEAHRYATTFPSIISRFCDMTLRLSTINDR